MNELLNISPIDGRYKNKVKDLENYFSEYALIKYRVFIELSWLKFIVKENIIDEKLSNDEINKIDKINEFFNVEEANKVKEIESKVKHDVKAVEYYLQDKFKQLNLERLIPFIHITMTSEDVNNTSYNLMIKDAINEIYYGNIESLINKIDELSNEYKSIPMLGHTHGQIASPTTVGKEFKVFSYRLKSVLELIQNLKLRSKFSGAVGNYNCHIVAYPNVDWIKETKKFVESLGLEYNPLTTQIESHDFICILLSYLKVLNNIIKDLNSDMWLYISNNYFHEKTNKNEVGSSVMPHKVNPINHENSMANIEISNGLIDALVNNLSISRMQRDLSDSSKMRNLGVIFSHSLVSIKETINGLNKIEVNKEYLDSELDKHYEVLTEAIQTVLRKNKIDNAYELLKELSRGKTITKKDINEFINKLNINGEDKKILFNLKPSDYIGLSKLIVDKN
ncbi:MAG: adenylosuccinate lyase [Bacilli bacterium]|nr:adenylosuccinate lyase [Bacilli bacterium]